MTMTETEWLNALIRTHARTPRAKRAKRKLRLFAVACSQAHLELDRRSRHAAVEAAEGFADGHFGPDELRAARLDCQGAGGQASWYAAATNPEIAARNAARSAQPVSPVIRCSAPRPLNFLRRLS